MERYTFFSVGKRKGGGRFKGECCHGLHDVRRKPIPGHTSIDFVKAGGHEGGREGIMVECRNGLHDFIFNGHAPYVSRWLHATCLFLLRRCGG